MRSRLTQSVALALVMAATLTLFEPLKSAIAHWDELTVGFTGMLRRLAEPFLVTALALAAVSALGARLLGSRGVALAAALLICLAVQATFFVWDYGQFDGRPIGWRENFALGLVDTAFWLAMLGLALLFPAILEKRASEILKIVLLFQVLSLGSVYFQAAPLAEKAGASAATEAALDLAQPEQELLSFSRDRNVLVIVLDTFQSDFFSELLLDPDFAAMVPPGFTYYRNAVSTYPTTFLSIPNILTARTSPRPKKIRRWRDRNMRVSLPVQIGTLDFATTVLVVNPTLLACDGQNPAIECTTPAVVTARLGGGTGVGLYERGEVQSLLGIATFRAAPHFLRPWIYAGGNWRISAIYGAAGGLESTDRRLSIATRRDLAILEALAKRSVVTDVKGTFKFLHFSGAHTPRTATRSCEPISFENAEGGDTEAERQRLDAVEASGCVLRLTFEFLRRLDALGVYDDSLVFIVGDHGDVDVPLELSLADPPIPGAGADATATTLSRGVPLFLAKRFDERGPLRVSDAPVALCDIPSSVFTELKQPTRFQCRSIFGNSNSWPASRPYLSHKSDIGPNPWGPRRGPFGHFQVRGHSWLQKSWVNDETRRRAPARRR